MIEKRWLFIGSDRRIAVCSEIMSVRGHSCRYVGSDVVTSELEKTIIEFKPNHIVFPILQMKSDFPVQILNKETKLFVGVAEEKWLRPFLDAGLEIQSFLEEEQFVWRNARLTAEGFIAEYYTRTKRVVSGEHFYVAGFGKVGKMVADVLSSLGADITILARSNTQLGEALSNHYNAQRLTSNFEVQEGCLVNTIPSQWFSPGSATKLRIFDLASAPGCLRDSRVFEYYTILPGLPGIHFPFDAATALADALDRMYRR
ncbi:hypothetical protein ACFSFY_11485 [Sporosarcina siberiensis]|uniref:Dipicolinate synthase subunit A n=1 Tax=Sporosarcina siberiensis TaxID=1365606 RepID=A0ABW4SGL0_9BACL